MLRFSPACGGFRPWSFSSYRWGFKWTNGSLHHKLNMHSIRWADCFLRYCIMCFKPLMKQTAVVRQRGSTETLISHIWWITACSICFYPPILFSLELNVSLPENVTSQKLIFVTALGRHRRQNMIWLESLTATNAPFFCWLIVLSWVPTPALEKSSFHPLFLEYAKY